jgi:hypothetical protein
VVNARAGDNNGYGSTNIEVFRKHSLPKEDWIMRTGASVLWVVVGALLVLSVSSQATRIVYQTPAELAKESSQIVRGRVSSVRSFWNESGSKIFTEVFVSVDETYKGPPLREARVLQLGGIVDHVNMHVEGALSWKPNEEVLLFLEPSISGAFAVSGFSQGKFAIERDRRTGRLFVRAAGLGAVELAGKPPGGGEGPPRKMPLDRFISTTMGRE